MSRFYFHSCDVVFQSVKKGQKSIDAQRGSFCAVFMRHFLVLNMSRTNSFNGYRCSNFLLEMARAAFCTRPFSFNCSVIGVVV